MRFLLAAFIYCSQIANAAPVAQISSEGVTIVVYDEPCALDGIKNLKYRATWDEDGVRLEGCVGQHPQFPVLMFYFADKTVALVPIQALQRVHGA